MKVFRRNIRVVGALLVAAFLGLSGWFGYTVYTQGSRWLASQYNTRLRAAKSSVLMGDVLDRNGIVLATSDAEGTRYYNVKASLRRAVSQTVGDTLSMSGTGVQTFHAGTLLGFSGSVIDRTWQWISGSQTTGDNIRLTVDAKLTEAVSEAFPEGYQGAVAVMNYENGEILCMVSKPDYDPEALSRTVLEAEDTAFLNRCLQGLYAPGSTMKIVTLAAALSSDDFSTDQRYLCTSETAIGQFHIRCAGGTAHGEMSLRQAFGNSCNTVFSGLAASLGERTLRDTAERMGFNDNFHFQDIVLYESSFPDAFADTGNLALAGIGQDAVLVTPLHMAMIAAAVAHDGVMPEPRLIAQVYGATGILKLRTTPGDYGRVMRVTDAVTIQDYLRTAVEKGTASNAGIDGYVVCGKTGSAETSDDKSVATNAWFVGYLDSVDAPYAIAVVIEAGGAGGDLAAKLAAKTFQYLTKDIK